MDAQNAKVIIFCGGRGLRLNEKTELRPKPLIEVGEKPILWHIMKIYSAHGFNDFVLPLGYKGDMIRDYFLNYGKHNSEWRVAFADTGADTQTGGRLSRVRHLVDTDYVMLTYGDGVGDMDIQKILSFHREHGKVGTVTGVKPPPRFGELTTDGGRVVKFSEKPNSNNPFNYINGGFFVFDKRIFNYVTDDENLSFEGEPLERLARDGELMIYRHDGFWHPMDTYRDWQVLNEIWSSGSPSWKIW